MSTSWAQALGSCERGTVTAPFFQRRKRTGKSLVLNPQRVRGDRLSRQTCLLKLKFFPSYGNIISFAPSFVHSFTLKHLSASLPVLARLQRGPVGKQGGPTLY